jgi:hypothetical protein
VHLECQEHLKLVINKEKTLQILEDLKIELTPYYTFYYNLLKAMEDEQISNHGSKDKGLRSATLHELKAKVTSELEQKQADIESEVLKKHRVTPERFSYSVEFYTTGTTEVLQENGVAQIDADPDVSKDTQLLLDEVDKLTSRGKFAYFTTKL